MEKISCHTGNNRCRMECCQRLHPQLVFKKQRSSPLCEVLAVEMHWRYLKNCIPISSKKQFQRWSTCFEKKEGKKKPVNMPQWNESKTHTKREFGQILAREFGTVRLAEMFVWLWRKRDLLEKRCFYEHGFRSAGMNVYVYVYVVYVQVHTHIPYSYTYIMCIYILCACWSHLRTVRCAKIGWSTLEKMTSCCVVPRNHRRCWWGRRRNGWSRQETRHGEFGWPYQWKRWVYQK